MLFFYTKGALVFRKVEQMGDIIVVLVLVIIVGVIFRYIYLERKKAKASCYGIGCIGCAKATSCSSLTPEELLVNLRKEIRQ